MRAEVRDISYCFPSFPAALIVTFPACAHVATILGGRRNAEAKAFALSYRQREHLDERSNLCHKKTSGEGKEIWLPPTKKEIRTFEIKGRSEKAFLLEMGYRYPQMIHELHTDHKFADRRSQISISDSELDSILYGGEAAAI